MRCVNCGSEIPDEAKEYPRCGTDVEVTQEREMQTETELTPPKSSKKNIYAVLISSVLVIAIAAAALFFIKSKELGALQVENITGNRWVLTDESSTHDQYEGDVSSNETRPFAAVIGESADDDYPSIVFMNEGQGKIQRLLPRYDDPTEAWYVMGYLEGHIVTEADIERIEYSGRDYYDAEYNNYTWSTVDINFVLSDDLTGLLIYDVKDNVTNAIKYNNAIAIVDGIGMSTYFADGLPYKSRGTEDLEIIPKFFCQANMLDESYHSSDSAFSMDKEEKNYNSEYLSDSVRYSGKLDIEYPEYGNGIIIYTRTQTAGGEPEEKDETSNRIAYLYEEKCSIETYASYDADSHVKEPEYDFHIVGYLPWKEIGQE